MRTLLWILPLVMLMSCSKYQYISISPSRQAARNASQGLIFEDDSVKVGYHFSGQNGPVTVEVTNKSQSPIQADWGKSAVIKENKTLPFYTGEAILSGEMTSTIRPSLSSQVTGTLQQPLAVEFIPPGATVSRKGPVILQGGFLSTQSYDMKRRQVREGEAAYNIREREFLEAESPLTFRVYLTLVNAARPAETKMVDEGFYISRLGFSRSTPGVVYGGSPSKDQFYVRRSTAAGVIIGGVTLAAVLVGLAALSGN